MSSILQIKDKLVAFISGKMTDPDDIIHVLQLLIDSGIDVKSNGKYSKIIKKLIDDGVLTGEKRARVSMIFDDLFD